jgi:hypothetical protein
MIAKTGTIEKEGEGKLIRPGGRVEARKMESMRSSEPHPVAMFSAGTPNLAARASFRSDP